MWDKFVYQFTYLDFNHILTILNQDVKSEEWFRSFMQRTSTRQFFEGLKLRDQLDFIEKLLTAFEYFQGQTNDMLVQDLDQLKDDEKNQSFNTILLLKPCTFEILHQEPYVQTVFLHCFLTYKRDKKLYDHIQKGFIRASSKIKFEFYIEFEDLITDKSWAFYKNKFMTMNNNVYSINLQPSYDQQFATMNGTNDKMITLIKAQQISDIGGESMKLSQPEFEYNQQNTDGSLEKIEKIYESFFNSLKTPIYTNIRQNMKV